MKTLLLGLVVTIMSASAQDISARESASESAKPFFPPNSTPYQRTLREWSAEWWQFVLSIPVPDNPAIDNTGVNCVIGQRGPVWFLAGSFGAGPVTRTCSIPEDRALFFPVINRIDINVTNQTVKQLRAEVAPCLDAVTKLSVELDGQPIGRLQDFRVKSVAFDLTTPQNGLLDPGTYSPVIDDGFYVMLKPLNVGGHDLHIIGEERGTSTCNALSVDIRYMLTVVPVELGRNHESRDVN